MMLPNKFKENRASSIEVLFHMFKSVPSNYYNEKIEELDNSSIQVIKNEIHTFRQVLNKKVTGYDFVEITSMYLSAFDQKILRAILQCVYKQEEQLFIDNLKIDAVSKDEEYIDKRRELYSNLVTIDINYFYKIFNQNSKTRSSDDIFEKICNSLDRLAKVILSFKCKKKTRIVTAPLLAFSKCGSKINLQVHPLIHAYKFESLNDNSLIKLEQPFYLIDNSEYFLLKTALEQLLYSKIQYKFASMPLKHKEISFDFNLLKSQIFLQSSSKKTNYNQTSKLKKAIESLNKNSSYSLKLLGTSKTLLLHVTR